MAGLWIVTAGTPLGPIFQWSVGPVVLIGLLTILHWVAFGAGVRKCSGGFSIPFFSSRGPVGDIGCRMAFGYAALLFDGVLAGAALTTLAKKRLEGTAQKIADGVGAALVVIPLLPLFAIAAPALLLQKSWSKLRSGWTEGPPAPVSVCQSPGVTIDAPATHVATHVALPEDIS